jgi:glucosamine-6-phosphate isomerase
MSVFIADSFAATSERACGDLIQLAQSIKDPLLCTASGDSPSGIYKNIVASVNENEVDISGWSFVGLDEWVGMNGTDEGSCRFYLNQQLFEPLKIPASKISFFDGRADNLDNECSAVENFITKRKGITVAILGLGMNGHIGMNEPGTSATLRSHVTDLDPVTQKVGQKYFKTRQELKQGITLGMATLIESNHIFLLVSGSHKAEIVKRMLESEISERLPCTLLRNHPQLRIYLDDAAAKLINQPE